LRGIRLVYFFMVPPCDAASPFLSAAPAVPAPCVLASFAEGMDVPVVAPVTPDKEWRMEVTDEFANPLYVLHINVEKPR
jgi:hypothetical protein